MNLFYFVVNQQIFEKCSKYDIIFAKRPKIIMICTDMLETVKLYNYIQNKLVSLKFKLRESEFASCFELIWSARKNILLSFNYTYKARMFMKKKNMYLELTK